MTIWVGASYSKIILVTHSYHLILTRPDVFNLDGRFMALPERITSLLVGRTEREIMEELRHEIRETLQAISDGLNHA